jgi:hypothetical protein
MEDERDMEDASSKKNNAADLELLSCCNIPNKCEQPLIGSSTHSFEALSTFSSMTNSSKQINFNSLDQIGASMEGTHLLLLLNSFL